MDNVKKASVKLAFTFGICLFSIVENCVVFSDGLTNGMFGSRLRKRHCECGEGEDEEDVFHIFSLSGLVLDLGRFVAV